MTGPIQHEVARKPSRRRRGRAPSLEVRKFAHLESAEIEFGDLTVLVGPQGAGKSLLLQLWKLALDSSEIVSALRGAGYPLATHEELLDAYFGEGMRTAWGPETEVRVDGKPFDPIRFTGKRAVPQAKPKVFFVPAHRALLMSEGWPAPFMRLKPDTPAVARLFSQSLYERFTGREAGDLFPVERRLKASVRSLIDESVFHGGRVQLEQAGLQTRLALSHGSTRLPFMTWTAGQREFTPLLLGLYQVLPARKETKHPEIDWVIIEEPEMGLHPQALNAVMALVLDLLARGYRVIVSTHSPFVLDVVFAMRTLAGIKDGVTYLRKAFGLPGRNSIKTMLGEALKRRTKTYALRFNEEGHAISEDISTLDPASDEAIIAEWGGLTGFSGNFGRAVAEAIAAEGA